MRMSLRARAGARLKAVSNWASVAPLARRQVGHDLCVEAHRADLVHRAADHSGRSPELWFTGTEPLRFTRAEPRPWRHSCLDRRGVRLPRTNPIRHNEHREQVTSLPNTRHGYRCATSSTL